MHTRLFIFFVFLGLSASAQDIAISSGWKFKTGDSLGWSSPVYNDGDWASIQVGQPWELQGYTNYDGFGWYRLHVLIPSSIKNKAYLKEKLRFDLGKIDDGDEVYLNGQLIGRNAGRPGDIKQGNYDLQRSYTLLLNDPRILWDKVNVITVRVYDGGGDGGMYAGTYGISVMDVTDYVVIGTNQNPFLFEKNRQVSKKIVLES